MVLVIFLRHSNPSYDERHKIVVVVVVFLLLRQFYGGFLFPSNASSQPHSVFHTIHHILLWKKYKLFILMYRLNRNTVLFISALFGPMGNCRGCKVARTVFWREILEMSYDEHSLNANLFDFFSFQP
jgi:hypothetical protein